MRRVCLLVLLVGCDAPIDRCAAAHGVVEGVVTDGLDGAPLAGVRVRSRECGGLARSDTSGRFTMSLPEGEHRLWLDREGYVEGQRANVVVRARRRTAIDPRLFPSAPSDAAIAAYFARQAPRRHAHPAHDRPRRDTQRDVDDVGAVRAGLDDSTLPDTIRVWRSGGTALQPTSANGWADRSCDPAAVVQEIEREEYVKGVIPHEWIPSWHPEALRAGAIAARSYAVNWWARGGRWDCADVDDGTVTQVYRDDRSARTNEAVDATAGQVAMRSGALFSTEYSAENSDPTAFGVDEPTCTGTTRFGHGRGMCQWGTHRWASVLCANAPCDWGALGAEPRDHTWMVEHYYPGATVVDCGEPALPCGVIPPEGGIVDDAGPCFTAFGPSMYWRFESAGWAGGLRWTNAFEASAPSNWARWRLHFEREGPYRVEAYVDATWGVYPETRYEIAHASGDATVIVHQGDAGGWVELGVFEFGAEGAVMVFDDYAGSIPADQHIVADAVRLTPMSETMDAGTVDAGTMDAGTMEPTDAGLMDAGPRGITSGCGCRAAGTRSPPIAMLIALLWLVRGRWPSRCGAPQNKKSR